MSGKGGWVGRRSTEGRTELARVETTKEEYNVLRPRVMSPL